MSRSGFPKKVFIVSAMIGGLASALALTSRFISPEVRRLFNRVGFGQASLIEHWLSGMAAVAFFVLVVAVFSHFDKPKPLSRAKLRQYWYVRTRKKALNMLRAIYIVHWAWFFSFVYACGSLGWELSQVHPNRNFQLDQFLMDIMGGVCCCMMLWCLLRSEYLRARRKCRSNFG